MKYGFTIHITSHDQLFTWFKIYNYAEIIMLINVRKCSSKKLGICRILRICQVTVTLNAHRSPLTDHRTPITTRNLELYESCIHIWHATKITKCSSVFRGNRIIEVCVLTREKRETIQHQVEHTKACPCVYCWCCKMQSVPWREG